MAYRGKFNPKNPKKYVGDPDRIVWRSTWEYKVMKWLDTSSAVINWSSEEFAIPYFSSIDKKFHRYFPDFLVKLKTKDNEIKTILIEVKPFKQTMVPKINKRKSKYYRRDAIQYAINQAKWDAAKEFCNSKGWEFKILTENEIYK